MGNVFTPDQDTGDPAAASDGHSIQVEVNCSHDGKCVSFSQHRGRNVTARWTASRLHAAIETVTGVHRSCQRLMFRGRVMEGSCTIESILGCDPGALPGRKIKLYLFVDRHRFPQKLGPFSVMPVQLRQGDFELPFLGEESRRSGFYWTLPMRALERHALQSKSGQISGQVSPLYAVNVDPAYRQRSGVPEGARDTVWSYPVENWSSVDSDAYYMECWERVADSDANAVKSFLSVGGFMYFDHAGEVLGVRTIAPHQEGAAASLHFGDPQRWLPEWTRALAEQGRFQVITIKALRDMGAELYLWLRPNEIIEGPDGNPLARQPSVPFGGFVYLFHRDLASTEATVVALDRYFAALERPPEPEPEEGKPTSALAFRAFTLAEPDPPLADPRIIVEPAHDGADALSDISGLVGTSFVLTTPRTSPQQTPLSSPEPRSKCSPVPAIANTLRVPGRR